MKYIVITLISIFSLGMSAASTSSAKQNTCHSLQNERMVLEKSKQNHSQKKNKFNFKNFSKKKLDLKAKKTSKEKAKHNQSDPTGCSDSILEAGCALIILGLSSDEPIVVVLTVAALVVVLCVAILIATA